MLWDADASAVNIYVSLANLLQKSDAEKNFQIFQTTAGLKKYKQHDDFFGGVWWVSELNLDHISLQIIII